MIVRWTGLVWDACGLVNLAATNRATEILLSLQCPSFVVQRVRQEEVIYLRPLPDDDPDSLELIDLGPLVEEGLLQEIVLGEAEQEKFVELAQQMDDGEAMTMAVSSERGFGLVTDDRVAKRVARSLLPPIVLLTTPEWIKQWADTQMASAKAVEEVLSRISLRARYRPHANDPLYGWWLQHSGFNGER